ncbi:MAG: DUF4337 domain-containing protein [Bryobacteraceae bacterium]|jgi:hypothetical protein
MSVDEELQEHSEHAKEPFDKKVAVTMAVIAAMLAIDGVMSHLFTTEELLLQQKASDQWAYYQAKSIRRYNSEVAADVFKGIHSEAAEPSVAKYEKNIEKYKKESEEVSDQAKDFEKESKLKGDQAHRLDYGEVFLEIGIVFASMAILTKRNLIWYVSMSSALVGLLIALSMFMVKS